MENTQTYDPTKQYSWQEKQDVTITGLEFGILQQFVQAYIQNEPQLIYKALNAQNVIAQIVKQEVEEGSFKEIVSESKTEELHPNHIMD